MLESLMCLFKIMFRNILSMVIKFTQHPLKIDHIMHYNKTWLFLNKQNRRYWILINRKCVLLDVLSDRILKTWIQSNSSETQEQQLIGKQKYTSLFVDIFPKQRTYYTINDNNTYVYMERNLHIEFQDQLTVAYYACNDPQMFILIAKPDEILQIEDLVCNFTLSELKEAFMLTIESIKKAILQEQAEASDSFQDILFLFRSHILKFHSHLFENYVNYQAALLQKSSRVVDKSCLFTNQFLSQQIVKVSKEKLLDYTKIYKDNTFNIKQKDELLEKIVISGYIIDYVLRIKAMAGKNPFENSIFESYLNSKDIPRFLELHQFYADQLYNIQNFIIQASLFKESQKSEYFTFNETIEKFKKNAQTYEYKFDVMQVSYIKQGLVLQELFKKQVSKIIQLRMMQGINQKDVISAMQNIQKDTYTQRDLKNYLKILLEANAMLGYPFKFPGNLKETMLPYIHNLQVEKAAQVASDLTFQPLTDNIKYATLPKKEVKSDEFTDDEDEDCQRYIVTNEGNTGKIPSELKNISFEEIQKIAEDYEQIKVKVDEEGNVELDNSIPKTLLKQEEVDQLLANLSKDQEEDLEPVKGKLVRGKVIQGRKVKIEKNVRKA